MKKLLIASASLALLTGAAMAQPKPQGVEATVPARVATYSAAIMGLVPAASTTDFFSITGSATEIIRIKRVSCSGISTASGTNPVQGVVRSTADTTGTFTSPTVVPTDSNSPAGTATVHAYTVNPSALGTLVGAVITGVIPTTVAATAAGASAMVWTFGDHNDQEPTLRGVAQTFALNGNAASFVSGATLSCDVSWTESAN